MQRLPLRLLIALLLAVLAGPAVHSGPAPQSQPVQLVAGPAADVTIYRDRWGVPSIVARDLPDALYGLGYAMAQDNAEHMARNYLLAQGRLAEVDGKGQLTQDSFIRALDVPEMARRKAAALTGETAAMLRSFCGGANRAMAEQKDRLPAWVQPIRPADVLALAQGMNVATPLQELAGRLFPGMGSNQFAVAPGRSANHHALLSMDPHWSWSGPVAWYEFGLYCRGISFRGITCDGLPLGMMGHNDRVAWSVTNNDPAIYGLFTVQTDTAHPGKYNHHGQWRPFEDRREEVRYLEDGQLKTTTVRIRRTAWGPMLPLLPWAVSLSTLDRWEMLEEAPAMMRARSARQFRDALRPLGLSMWNFVYADTSGHIGYQYNARVPRRDPSFDWTKPVPGGDPRTAWGEPWTLDELPHIEDPPSGLLVNCNSAPWLTPVGPGISSQWPAYVTTYGATTRYERLAELLSADQRVTLDTARRYATDTRVPYAQAAVRALAAIPAEKGSAFADAVAALTAWDGRADIGSRGCALYAYWLNAVSPALRGKLAGGTAWTPEEQQAARAALEKAAADLEPHGGLSTDWGDVHVMQRGALTQPMNGFTAPGGQSAVTPAWGQWREGRCVCTGGSSWRMVVDLAPRGIRSWSILPFGAAQDPANPHYADQMPLFSRGEYKETSFGPAAARRASVATVVLRRERR